MTSTDVQRVFQVRDTLVLPGGYQVGVDTFAQLFAAAPGTPTRTDLDAIDQGVLGYAAFIAQALAGGLIEEGEPDPVDTQDFTSLTIGAGVIRKQPDGGYLFKTTAASDVAMLYTRTPAFRYTATVQGLLLSTYETGKHVPLLSIIQSRSGEAPYSRSGESGPTKVGIELDDNDLLVYYLNTSNTVTQLRNVTYAPGQDVTATIERAAALRDQILSWAFLTDRGLFSLSRFSPHWHSDGTAERNRANWNGPAWVNLGYVVAKGFLRYGFSDAHDAVAEAYKAALERWVVRAGVWGVPEWFDPQTMTAYGYADYSGWGNSPAFLFEERRRGMNTAEISLDPIPGP